MGCFARICPLRGVRDPSSVWTTRWAGGHHPGVPDPQPNLSEPCVSDSELDAAYRRAGVAYQLARRAVFDRFPSPRLPESDLSDEQRVLLRDLAEAEQALAEARRHQWTSAS